MSSSPASIVRAALREAMQSGWRGKIEVDTATGKVTLIPAERPADPDVIDWRRERSS